MAEDDDNYLDQIPRLRACLNALSFTSLTDLEDFIFHNAPVVLLPSSQTQQALTHQPDELFYTKQKLNEEREFYGGLKQSLDRLVRENEGLRRERGKREELRKECERLREVVRKLGGQEGESQWMGSQSLIGDSTVNVDNDIASLHPTATTSILPPPPSSSTERVPSPSPPPPPASSVPPPSLLITTATTEHLLPSSSTSPPTHHSSPPIHHSSPPPPLLPTTQPSHLTSHPPPPTHLTTSTHSPPSSLPLPLLSPTHPTEGSHDSPHPTPQQLTHLLFYPNKLLHYRRHLTELSAYRLWFLSFVQHPEILEGLGLGSLPRVPGVEEFGEGEFWELSAGLENGEEVVVVVGEGEEEEEEEEEGPIHSHARLSKSFKRLSIKNDGIKLVIDELREWKDEFLKVRGREEGEKVRVKMRRRVGSGRGRGEKEGRRRSPRKERGEKSPRKSREEGESLRKKSRSLSPGKKSRSLSPRKNREGEEKSLSPMKKDRGLGSTIPIPSQVLRNPSLEAPSQSQQQAPNPFLAAQPLPSPHQSLPFHEPPLQPFPSPSPPEPDTLESSYSPASLSPAKRRSPFAPKTSTTSTAGKKHKFVLFDSLGSSPRKDRGEVVTENLQNTILSPSPRKRSTSASPRKVSLVAPATASFIPFRDSETRFSFNSSTQKLPSPSNPPPNPSSSHQPPTHNTDLPKLRRRKRVSEDFDPTESGSGLWIDEIDLSVGGFSEEEGSGMGTVIGFYAGMGTPPLPAADWGKIKKREGRMKARSKVVEVVEKKKRVEVNEKGKGKGKKREREEEEEDEGEKKEKKKRKTGVIPTVEEIDMGPGEDDPNGTQWMKKVKLKRHMEVEAKREELRAAKELAKKKMIEVNPERNGGEIHHYKEVVRNKEERKKMFAGTCDSCQQWYERTGSVVSGTCSHNKKGGQESSSSSKTNHLQDREQELRLKAISRHRAQHRPDPEPVGYWQMGFPGTQQLEKINQAAAAQREEKRAYQEREANTSGGFYRYA